MRNSKSSITGFLESGTKVDEGKKIGRNEDRIIHMMERAQHFRDYNKQFEKLRQGTMSVPAFIQELSHEATMVLVESMRADDPRLAFDAARDVLDRAGHGKLQKVAVAHANVDHETSRRELINIIMSSAKKTGIKVKGEDYAKGLEMDDSPIIDVELSDAPDSLRAKARDTEKVPVKAKKSTPTDSDN